MNKNVSRRCYSYRIKLEKLKRSTALLIVVGRGLLFLAALIHLLGNQLHK